ncbi:MAG: WYL domain-containing protein [Alphaproteobacteria bacterium]|nr:WYL domain-containing protein [Alphaproteobacteria bacterium]
MRLNKSQKMLQMVQLMNRRGGVRAIDLMERFDLDPRSLRRYLADLRALDLPLIDEGTSDDRTLALDPSYRRAGVQLTLPEVLSLHFGRTLFTFLDGTQFAADLDDAIERLEPAIPRAHADLAKDLDRRFMAVPEHAKDSAGSSEIIDELMTALLYQSGLRARYRKADGQERDCVLEPYTLATYRQGLYVFAKDRGDGRVKTFAVERFSKADRLRHDHFVVPEDYKPEDVVRDAFGIIGGPPVDIAAVFDADIAPLIRERRWHHSQFMDDLPDGRVRLHVRVAISEELVGWLLSYAGKVEVERPASLVDRLLEAHRAALGRLQARKEAG